MMDPSLSQSSPLPLVSVIVLTRNRADSLDRTLKALSKLEYESYEVIVVDNGSTDHTPELARERPVRYLFCPPEFGIARCRREGVSSARGEIIAFCDDDCVPFPDWLTHIVHRLSVKTDIGILGGQIINIGFQGKHEYKGRQKWTNRNGKLAFCADPAEADFFGNANLSFRKDVYDTLSGYDPFYIAGMAEIDLAMQFHRAGYRSAYEPKATVEHHFTGLNLKRGRFFYDLHLMRLYFYLKHFRPAGLKQYAAFGYRELRILAGDLWKWSRAFASALFKGKFQRLKALPVELLNIISARIAIPWILHLHSSAGISHPMEPDMQPRSLHP